MVLRLRRGWRDGLRCLLQPAATRQAGGNAGAGANANAAAANAAAAAATTAATTAAARGRRLLGLRTVPPLLASAGDIGADATCACERQLGCVGCVGLVLKDVWSGAQVPVA